MDSLIMALSVAFVLDTKPWLFELVQIIIKSLNIVHPIIIFKRRTRQTKMDQSVCSPRAKEGQ